jgi:hypothetical protein
MTAFNFIADLYIEQGILIIGCNFATHLASNTAENQIRK